MKFDVDDKNRCRLVCVKFHLNRCRFAVAVAKCLGAHFFGDTVYNPYIYSRLIVQRTMRTSEDGSVEVFLLHSCSFRRQFDTCRQNARSCNIWFLN